MQYSDIMNLIAMCHQADVSELELEGLKLKFRGKPGETFHAAQPPQPAATPATDEEVAQRREQLAQQLEDEWLEELRLSDPYEFEQRMAKRQQVNEEQDS